MSVKVNLLPRDVKKREAAGQQRALTALGFLVLLVVLGAVWFWQNGQRDTARQELAAEEQELERLRSEEAELVEYRELQQRREQASETIQFALAGSETSMAGLLQDVAAVAPTDVQLDTVTVTLAEEPAQSLGDTRPALGTLTMTGWTLEGHAPGLERFLIELEKVAAFSDIFFTNSTIETEEGVPPGVIEFSIEVDLGFEVLTGRYLEGLPEVLR